jgi:hypothetical protein
MLGVSFCWLIVCCFVKMCWVRPLTKPPIRDEILAVKTRRVCVPVAIVVAQPFCLRAASYYFPANPVGEAVYRPHLLRDMLPLAVIVCALLLGWLLRVVQLKAKKFAPDYFGLHHD